jgi:hypothetical protein
MLKPTHSGGRDFSGRRPSAAVARRCRPHAVLEAVERRVLLAAVFVVDTLLDETAANATTSLREAVQLAAAGDTVAFKPGLAGTITLGGTQLAIDKNLTVAGPGAGVLAVSGDAASRVLRVGAGAAVTLVGLTIRNGGGVSEGGGIYNAGALTLTNCTVRDSAAAGAQGSIDHLDGGTGRGGGIFNTGTLTVTDATLSGNAAVGGDGVSRTIDPYEPDTGGVGGQGLGGAI